MRIDHANDENSTNSTWIGVKFDELIANSTNTATDGLDGFPDGLPLCDRRSVAELYVDGELSFHVHLNITGERLWRGESEVFCAVFEQGILGHNLRFDMPARERGSGGFIQHLNPSQGMYSNDNIKQAVLVSVRELMEKPEDGDRFRLAVHKRLVLFDECSCRVVQSTDLSTTGFPIFSFVEEDRILRSRQRNSVFVGRRGFIDQVIERRTQVVDNVAKGDRPFVRHLLQNPEDCPPLSWVNITLKGDSVSAITTGLEESLDFSSEILGLTLCSSNF